MSDNTSAMYVSSKFLGEMLKDLLLALAGLKYGTMSQDAALAIYDYWIAKLGDEVGITVLDDPDLVKTGDN